MRKKCGEFGLGASEISYLSRPSLNKTNNKQERAISGGRQVQMNEQEENSKNSGNQSETKTSSDWEVIKNDPELYVTRKTMESIPKKPDEPEPEEPCDTWNKVCPAPTVDEYGQDKWEAIAPNTVPTRECGWSALKDGLEAREDEKR